MWHCASMCGSGAGGWWSEVVALRFYVWLGGWVVALRFYVWLGGWELVE